MTSLGDFFIRNTLPSEQGIYTPEMWKTKKESSTIKQEKACTVIKNCPGYDPFDSLQTSSTVATILDKIEFRFCLTTEALSFSLLIKKYHNPTLADYTRVIDNAEKD